MFRQAKLHIKGPGGIDRSADIVMESNCRFSSNSPNVYLDILEPTDFGKDFNLLVIKDPQSNTAQGGSLPLFFRDPNGRQIPVKENTLILIRSIF